MAYRRCRQASSGSRIKHAPNAPLAIENVGLYSPMAWVIIGGLLSSTLLARLVTPVMYKLIPPAITPVVSKDGQTGGTLATPAGALPAPASRVEH